MSKDKSVSAMEEELKPCPHCSTHTETDGVSHVWCGNIYNCDAQTRLGRKAWNRRAMPAATAGDALRGQIVKAAQKQISAEFGRKPPKDQRPLAERIADAVMANLTERIADAVMANLTERIADAVMANLTEDEVFEAIWKLGFENAKWMAKTLVHHFHITRRPSTPASATNALTEPK